MLMRHSLTGIILLFFLLFAGFGCQAADMQADQGYEQTQELIVFVTNNSLKVREKAESFGLKTKLIESNSAASQLIQTLLNSPTKEYFVVINPTINRYITAGAISEKVDPFELDELFRRMRQVSKAGVEQIDRLKPENSGNARLLVFSDFQCPGCRMMEEFLPLLQDKYGEKLEVEFVHFPLNSHPLAFDAAEATECARVQGKFEEYKDEIFAQQKNLTKWSFDNIAGKLKLDRKAFSKCLSLHQERKKVRQDQYFGQYLGINATPTLVLNGQILQGMGSEEIQAMIDEALEKAALAETSDKKASQAAVSETSKQHEPHE